jgi:hypothetical protein
MRGVANPLRATHLTGYDAVRLTLGFLLLVAAGLKGYQLATEPVLCNGLFDSRWFLIGVVQFELFFGLWPVAGLYPKFTWTAAVVCFGLFAGVSLWKGISGQTSCGCFGRVEVDPWWTCAFDCAVVLALWWLRPNYDRKLVSERHTIVSALNVGALWVALAAPAGVAMAGYAPSTITDGGAIVGEERVVVLVPEAWIGRPLPLLKFIDIADQLASGDWLVLLYHHGCPECQRAMLQYDRLADDLARDGKLSRVALIEVPPYDPFSDRSIRRNSACCRGRLGAARTWFVETPVVLSLNEGRVTSVSDG